MARTSDERGGGGGEVILPVDLSTADTQQGPHRDLRGLRSRGAFVSCFRAPLGRGCGTAELSSLRNRLTDRTEGSAPGEAAGGRGKGWPDRAPCRCFPLRRGREAAETPATFSQGERTVEFARPAEIAGHRSVALAPLTDPDDRPANAADCARSRERSRDRTFALRSSARGSARPARPARPVPRSEGARRGAPRIAPRHLRWRRRTARLASQPGDPRAALRLRCWRSAPARPLPRRSAGARSE